MPNGESAILYAQLMAAQRDATRWLSIAQSNEERVYIRRMQVCLGDLLRILDRTEIRHRIESRGRASKEAPAPSGQPEWNQNMTAFLKAFQGARDARGSVVGRHLDRAALSLGQPSGQSKRGRTNPEKKAAGADWAPQGMSERPVASNQRGAFLKPILDQKGFSVHDWARQADVDFHTANDYLNGKTNPYKSTRRKLADAIGLKVEELPR